MTYTYIFISPSLPFRYKIGISTRPTLRKKQVDRVAWKIFALPCLNAKAVESICHKIFGYLNCPVNGNGGTEWFWTLNIIFAALAYWYGFGFEYCLFALLIPFPFDGLIVLITIWALQSTSFVAAVLAVLWLLNQLN